jgi:hypothetical protein
METLYYVGYHLRNVSLNSINSLMVPSFYLATFFLLIFSSALWCPCCVLFTLWSTNYSRTLVRKTVRSHQTSRAVNRQTWPHLLLPSFVKLTDNSFYSANNLCNTVSGVPLTSPPTRAVANSHAMTSAVGRRNSHPAWRRVSVHSNINTGNIEPMPPGAYC